VNGSVIWLRQFKIKQAKSSRISAIRWSRKPIASFNPLWAIN